MLNRFIFGQDKNIQKNAFMWNIIASSLGAGLSAVLLVVVNRTIGDYQAGVFTLAYSIAQMMMTIGYFDMRAYQTTDIFNPIEFKYYFTSRLITCASMIFVSVFYVIIKGYDPYQSKIIILICVLRMLDTFEDVLHGLFQKNGRLDVGGRLQSIRFMALILSFTFTLLISSNLVLSIIITIIISALIIISLNIPIVYRFSKIEIAFRWSKLRKLFLACAPLFLGSYLAMYMENSPKYAIEEFLTKKDQAYYGMLAMMAFVVNLFSGFAFRPLLTPLAEKWTENKKKDFLIIIKKLLIWVMILTIICMIGAYFFGIPVLSAFFGSDLSGLRPVLLVIIFAGGINSFGTILYYAITVMRKQKWLLGGYICTAVLAYFISPLFVKVLGIMGAALSFAVIVAFRGILFLIIFFVSYMRKKNENV